MPAVRHDRARRIELHQHVRGLLHFLRGNRVLAGDMAVDEGNFVLHRPDENRGMVALTLGPGQQLLAIIVPDPGIGHAVKAGRALAVEDARAAHRHAFTVAIIEEIFGHGVRRPNTKHALVFLDQVGRRSRFRIGKGVERYAVDLEIRAVPGPLAKTEFGFALVDDLAADGKTRDDVILLGIVRPPELGILPRLGKLDDGVLSGGKGDVPGGESFFRRSARQRLDLIGELPGDGRAAGIVQRDLEPERLVLHRRLGKNVGRVGLPAHDQLRRVKDEPGCVAAQHGHIEIVRQVEVPEIVRDVAGMLDVVVVGKAVKDILERYRDFVHLAGLDRAGHVAVPDCPAIFRPAALLAVDENRRDEAFPRHMQDEGVVGQFGRHFHARAEIVAVDVSLGGHDRVAVTRDRDGMPRQGLGIGEGLDRAEPVVHLHFVVAGVLPGTGERHRIFPVRGGGNVEGLRRRALVRIGLPGGVAGLDRAVGMKRRRG